MNKAIGSLLLLSWAPFVFGMAFPTYDGSTSGWYTIAGLMWLVFGTWSGILLVNDKK